MGYIKELSEELIKQIAAGEVIERPASVVKELVENSIDAGSEKIEIQIERAGKYIKVSDDGSGIDPDDIELLFKRHATSKLKSFEDLWDIHSLGFRGEALASISSISKIVCKSKHEKRDSGFEISVLEGKITKKSSSINKGTEFEINDLFYNVPARLKFLKSEKTEIDHIYDTVIAIAIANPGVAICLKNNSSILLNSSGSGDLQECICELLGDDLRKNLIPLNSKNNFVTLTGFISSLDIFRNDRKSIFVFINGRPVKCNIISKAILSSMEGLLPPGKYPVVILNLLFSPKSVDINVHPTKKEVRYTFPNEVYNLVQRTIQDSISKHYKEVYKEKSNFIQKPPFVPSQPYSDSAFAFYEKDDTLNHPSSENLDILSFREGQSQAKESHQESIINRDYYVPSELTMTDTTLNLFSVNNLKCYKISSDKPIANITKIGNKSIFEVGHIFDENNQVVFSGEIVGGENIQKEFFNSLSTLADKLVKIFNNENSFQVKLLIENEATEDDELSRKSKISRKKPPSSTLYKIWSRDNWTCVYCGKQLLDPELVNEYTSDSKDAFSKYLNENDKEVTVHLLREHLASYDHYLPVSKLPQFNFEEENLYACCTSCNKKKLDSMDLKSWKPEKRNNWIKPLEVAGLRFEIPCKKELIK